jgi:hypothetical protein
MLPKYARDLNNPWCNAILAVGKSRVSGNLSAFPCFYSFSSPRKVSPKTTSERYSPIKLMPLLHFLQGFLFEKGVFENLF